MNESDIFNIEVDTIRELTPDQTNLVSGGLAADPNTWSVTMTMTAVPGTEWTIVTVTTVTFG